MKLESFTLELWQQHADEFRAVLKANPQAKKYEDGPCFRIDGTIMSTARFYGGMTLNGVHYTTFSVPGTDGAVVACREDFMRWLGDKLNPKKARKLKRKESTLL